MVRHAHSLYLNETSKLTRNVGIDIDWEFPTDATQGQNFVLLLQAVRQVCYRGSTHNR